MCEMGTSLLQVVRSSILQLYRRSTFILLVPLLIFNGFEQGFIYSDYTKVCVFRFVCELVITSLCNVVDSVNTACSVSYPRSDKLYSR